jgi:lipopolysaccharide transport system ATP-binding protein
MGEITISNIGKSYKQYHSQWLRLKEWLSPFSHSYHQLKWVLQDISFTIKPGEAVGVIGINGAGKSTLLKIITGTTQPTTGSIKITGQVAALLELGMGFHPDFTGRQNAYMAGQLLGMGVDEITQLMTEIEAFAEIGDYIDQPVRVYSSGMQMRLAFSLATARRPDVLIIDEALSVGDAYFQHKSFNRIREYRQQGTTLLIVSHDKASIQSICDRAILLENGRVAMEGNPEAVMDFYNAMLANRANHKITQNTDENGKLQTISGTGEAQIVDVKLLDSIANEVEIVNVGQIVNLKIHVKVFRPIPELVVGYMIKDRLGQSIYGTNTHHLKKTLNDISQDQLIDFNFEFNANLGEGTYSIAIALHTAETHIYNNYEWRDLAVVFNVINQDKQSFVGVAWLPPNCTVKKND